MLPASSLWDFKVKNLSFYMPQTRVQYLCNFLCNRKNKVTEFVFVHESGSEGVKIASEYFITFSKIVYYVNFKMRANFFINNDF